MVNNPIIHGFFKNFLVGYAYRFAKKQNLTADCPFKFEELLLKTYSKEIRKMIINSEEYPSLEKCWKIIIGVY